MHCQVNTAALSVIINCLLWANISVYIHVRLCEMCDIV